jgi:uracil-DNA glycosylase family 4
MAEPIDFARQLALHLDSLRAAGVLFVPRGAALALPPPVAPAAVEEPADPMEARRHELEVLRAEIAACDKCSELFSTRTQTVFGTGPLGAEVMFVGAAPGPDEDARGEPFVGKGGQLLGRMVAACGFTREHVYLMNVIKCRPPKNRAPTNPECANCRDFFRRQFEAVKPRFVVALGAVAGRLLAGKKGTVADLRGAVLSYRDVPLVCTHHPDDIERDASGALKREAWEDLKLMLGALGRPVTGAK